MVMSMAALPKTLVNAFRATLEELSDADLLLHVIDASDPEHSQQIEAVEKILESLELNETPRLLVFNKCDRLEGGINGAIARALVHSRDGIAISAVTGEGFRELLTRAENVLWREGKVLPPVEEPFAAGRRLQATRG